MADASPKKVRKSNFSPEEVDALFSTVGKYYNVLFGAFPKRAVRNETRQKVWTDITRQVNRVSIEKRTLQEVKNKWKKCQHLYRERDASEEFGTYEMKRAKHRANKNNKRIRIRQNCSYEPDFKKAVILYAEQKKH
ncbi:hypothetical protein NQ315_002371 [Exocentrus adspersus]|uniref:Regulatory protein zeste n=1 Tax=Exocentrus adspersus TaxID=1586481 RepID=A0AAV8VSZ0_9CUCU|nr:hypothetical protein NQ315_002371 [Exocentrus adspersus]